MILIGSKAIKHHFPDFNREPKDMDFAIEGNTYSSECVEYLKNPVMVKYCKNTIATPNELYTLKLSHLFWDINWTKHLWDFHFLQDKGAVVIKPLFEELYSYWNEVHSQNRRSDLQMSSEDFFNNVVNCKYDHDWLHTLINPISTFNKVLKDGEEVEVSEDKFNLLTEEEKKALLVEEVVIMAFERFSHLHYRQAYSKMLVKFIQNHAPLWEAIWILQNYRSLYKPEYDFIKHLNNLINERGENITYRSTGSVKQQI